MDDSIHGVLCKYFRDGRDKLVGKDDVIESKHKVRQLLGWRTRGQFSTFWLTSVVELTHSSTMTLLWKKEIH